MFFSWICSSCYIRERCWMQYCHYGYVQTSSVYTYCISAARRWVKYGIFRAFSKQLKRLSSAVLYFAEQITNKIWTDKLSTHTPSQVKALRDESVVTMTLYARNGALVLILSALTCVAGGVTVNMTMDRKQEGEGFATAETHRQTPVLLRGLTTKDVEMERSLRVTDPPTEFDSPVTVRANNNKKKKKK